MAQLMMKNQEQFVPISPPQGSASPKVLETIFFYGDALTEERASGHLETGIVKFTD